MNPEPDDRLVSVNARLAAYLSEHQDGILLEWLDRVKADAAIPTESLTTAQLKDHVPHLFRDLAASLRYYGSEAVADKAADDATIHAVTRWEQGYELSELLREIKHLRAILIHHLLAFEDLHPDFGAASRLFAVSTLHQFLDDMGIGATEAFVQALRAS